MTGRDEIRWGPRVPRAKIRRLYESDAAGIYDEELIDDVGITLLVRCRSILEIYEARRGRVRCHRCARGGVRTMIERQRPARGDPRDELIRCPVCGWELTWGDYAKSFQRKQLNPGGAVSSFRRYVADYRQARTPRAKMLAIDRLIHEFHYSLRAQPDLPTRPVAANLIEGRLSVIEPFLDELTYGTGAPAELRERRAHWRRELAARDRWLEEHRRRREQEAASQAADRDGS
jgi:hypothetical protein